MLLITIGLFSLCKAQGDIIALGVYGKKPVSVKFIAYEGQLRRSGIDKTILLEDSESLEKLQQIMASRSISFEKDSRQIGIAYITFEDASVVSAYIYKDALGFNYGKTRLKAQGIAALFE
ncbi:MAG: hypothetical protein GX061_01570 [Eubacteriaceae bacterium]|nr:hypothetical protein [Eubacteriaceae bacterium]